APWDMLTSARTLPEVGHLGLVPNARPTGPTRADEPDSRLVSRDSGTGRRRVDTSRGGGHTYAQAPYFHDVARSPNARMELRQRCPSVSRWRRKQRDRIR